jgi:hypothetical protein
MLRGSISIAPGPSPEMMGPSPKMMRTTQQRQHQHQQQQQVNHLRMRADLLWLIECGQMQCSPMTTICSSQSQDWKWPFGYNNLHFGYLLLTHRLKTTTTTTTKHPQGMATQSILSCRSECPGRIHSIQRYPSAKGLCHQHFCLWTQPCANKHGLYFNFSHVGVFQILWFGSTYASLCRLLLQW